MPSRLKDHAKPTENRRIMRLRSQIAQICGQHAGLDGDAGALATNPDQNNKLAKTPASRGNSDGKSRLLPLDHGDIDQHLGGGLTIAALHEVRCEHARDAGAATGFMLALMERLLRQERTARESEPLQGSTSGMRYIVWITDPALSAENATLFPAVFEQFGLTADQFIMVHPTDLQTAMWAADEVANCPDILAGIFHVKGNPVTFNMTASRRLMLRARRSGRPSFILRQSGVEEASAVETRWQIQPAPALPDSHYEAGIGQMRHVLSLERNRNGKTGSWLISPGTVGLNPEKADTDHAASRKPSGGTTPARTTQADRNTSRNLGKTG